MSTTGCDARDARSPLASPNVRRLANAALSPLASPLLTLGETSARGEDSLTQLYQTLLRSLSASHFYVKVCHDSMDTPQKNYLVNAYEP
ncbi:hypothetical protein [Nostoc sp.]|uniref:hypothetical protein n=1 Tax=Nostoc sp. TaxID=1180 RepID=UPI002FF47682